MFLLIDNYDSFTYNLYHALGELGAQVAVVRNDQIAMNEAWARGTSGIILSPGPGTPETAGICLDLARTVLNKPLPFLGVCLGHQCLGQAAGAQVVRAPVQMHGKVSTIEPKRAGLFEGLKAPLAIARYHSLIIDRIPPGFVETANCEGQIMAMSHATLPLHGVQFHPESIATPAGKRILKNFLDQAAAWNSLQRCLQP